MYKKYINNNINIVSWWGLYDVSSQNICKYSDYNLYNMYFIFNMHRISSVNYI